MKILVFAPHPDDEVLGCGGVIAKYSGAGDKVTVCIVTSGHPPIYDVSVAESHGWPHNLYPEIINSHKILGVSETVFFEYPAADLESVPRYILNDKVQRLVQRIKPEIVYIPHFGDMQRDHALTSEAVMVSMRPRGDHIVRSVYAYETLSETEWNIPHISKTFIPNIFVDISSTFDMKVEAMNCYQSQLSEFPEPRSIEAVASLAKLRGSTSGVRYAEAFSLVREYL